MAVRIAIVTTTAEPGPKCRSHDFSVFRDGVRAEVNRSPGIRR